MYMFLTYHTLSGLHPLRPVLVLPAEERSQGHHDGDDPHQADHHRDVTRVTGVDVVRLRHGPVSIQQVIFSEAYHMSKK